MNGVEDVQSRMRRDWDERARLDARFFVAFGRREQTREEFLATAWEVLFAIEDEFRRFGPRADLKKLTALEIGCGPGRLMLPLSERFGRVIGFDVSGGMIELARENLANAPNAEPRRNGGSDLPGVDDESIDFCYSYAVFQHIPDKEVVWNYLRETVRVLKAGGFLKLQFNGLPSERGVIEGPPPVTGWSRRSGSVRVRPVSCKSAGHVERGTIPGGGIGRVRRGSRFAVAGAGSFRHTVPVDDRPQAGSGSAVVSRATGTGKDCSCDGHIHGGRGGCSQWALCERVGVGDGSE